MLYPIVVELKGRDVLVVGGGHVAERKVRRLIEAEAAVRVVTRAASEQIERWGADGQIRLELADFSADQLGQPDLVFAATDEPATNDAVVRAAREQGVFANSAAGAVLDFVVPAIGRADGIGVAVWSGSPALSIRLRDDLMTLVDDRWRLAGRVFDGLRRVLDDRGDASRRGAFWRNLAAGVPQEFRTPALARRIVRAVASGAGLALEREELDHAFELAED